MPASAQVLFKDDFSNDSSGWDIYSDAKGMAFYQNGWLHVRNNAINEGSDVSYANQYFTDFVLEVETKLVDGSEDNWHYVAFRADGPMDCYLFEISADGYYAMVKYVNGSRIVFEGPTKSTYIKQGRDMINTVRVEALGSDLRLFVNGHVLGNVNDSTFTGGDIGLGASLPEGTPLSGSQFTEVAFDNITVTVP
jgi:hypothetical protein